jgi:hypothetical protein
MKAPGDVGVDLPANGPASRRLVVQLRPSAVFLRGMGWVAIASEMALGDVWGVR